MNTIEELLAANREAIVQDWYHHILDTYPAETAKLWKKGGDPFSNPVAVRSRQGAEAVVRYLSMAEDPKALEAVLDFLDEDADSLARDRTMPIVGAGLRLDVGRFGLQASARSYVAQTDGDDDEDADDGESRRDQAHPQPEWILLRAARDGLGETLGPPGRDISAHGAGSSVRGS